MAKKRTKKKSGGLKQALKKCKGKKGAQWNKCLKKQGIKKKK